MELILKCTPTKSFGLRGEPLPISIDIDCGCSSGSETVKLMSSKLSSKIKSFSSVPIVFEFFGGFHQWRHRGGWGEKKRKNRRKMRKERKRKNRRMKEPKPMKG